jgi:hypothetical protein
VIQSFTQRVVTDYVYDLPVTGKAAKGLWRSSPRAR